MEEYHVSIPENPLSDLILVDRCADKSGLLSCEKAQRGRYSDSNHRLEVEAATEFDSKNHSHRAVLAVMDINTQECRPSVGELIALVSWMLGGMSHQDVDKMSKHRTRDGILSSSCT